MRETAELAHVRCHLKALYNWSNHGDSNEYDQSTCGLSHSSKRMRTAVSVTSVSWGGAASLELFALRTFSHFVESRKGISACTPFAVCAWTASIAVRDCLE